MRRKSRFTLKEVLTLIQAAQKERARVVIELDEAGKFRLILNDLQGPIEPDHEVVLKSPRFTSSAAIRR